MMSTTPLQQLENLRWYIQQLIHESGYLHDNDESNFPLSEDKWMVHTHGKFMKYVLFTLHRMTPEKLNMNPFKPTIKVITNQELDVNEGESNKDEKKSTTSSEMSEQDSDSDTTADDTEESEPTETLEIHNVSNKTIHHEDDSFEEKSVTEIEPPKQNGEQKIGKEDKLCTTNFEVKMENQKVEGLISYSFEQQSVKSEVNSGSNQELWGVCIDFQSYQYKWTIHGILQHMGFYPSTENPHVMMRENLKATSCEYILIYHDELYIGSTTPQEILCMLQDRTRSLFIYKVNFHMIQVKQIFVNSWNIWKSYIQMLICFSKTATKRFTHCI